MLNVSNAVHGDNNIFFIIYLLSFWAQEYLPVIFTSAQNTGDVVIKLHNSPRFSSFIGQQYVTASFVISGPKGLFSVTVSS
jgi:hypothetical protein